MEQRISLITLGVRDLARARAFYEGLGWTTRAAAEDDVVFFQAGGMVVALWDRARLAEDSGVEDSGGWGGTTLAHNVRSPAEVDAVIEEARGGRRHRPRARQDLLGRLLGRLHRPGRPPLGGRPQPALDDPRRRLGRAAGITRRGRLSSGLSSMTGMRRSARLRYWTQPGISMPRSYHLTLVIVELARLLALVAVEQDASAGWRTGCGTGRVAPLPVVRRDHDEPAGRGIASR